MVVFKPNKRTMFMIRCLRHKEEIPLGQKKSTSINFGFFDFEEIRAFFFITEILAIKFPRFLRRLLLDYQALHSVHFAQNLHLRQWHVRLLLRHFKKST